jgi:hypothetical protein
LVEWVLERADRVSGGFVVGKGREALIVFLGIPATVLVVGAAVSTMMPRPPAVTAPAPTERPPTVPAVAQVEVAKAWSAPAAPPVDVIPPMPSIPHAFTVLPKDYDHAPPDLVKDAQAVLDRWKAWKAKPSDTIVPYADWATARSNLTSIKAGSAEYARAKDLAARLDEIGIALSNEEIKRAEAIRAKERAKEQLALLNDVGGRRGYAKKLEDNFLRNSMDATVTIEGDKGTTLRVKYVLFSRPLMFKLQEEGKLIPDIIEQAKARGFRRLIMWDGYRFTWTWDLAKA